MKTIKIGGEEFVVMNDEVAAEIIAAINRETDRISLLAAAAVIICSTAAFLLGLAL